MRGKSIYEKLPLAVMFLIVYFVSIIQPALRAPIVIVSGVLLIGYTFISGKSTISVDNFTKGWMLTLLVVFISMLINGFDQFYLLYYIICTLFLLLYGNNSVAWAEWSINLIAFMGLFYAAFTIIQVLMPSFYTAYIAPIMNTNSTFDPLRFMRIGVYSGFTYQTAVNSLYLAMGIGASFTKFLFAERKKWIYIIPIAIEMICILLSAKRGHIVFAAISLLFVAFMNSSRSKRFSTLLKIVVALFVLMMLAYYFIPSASYFFEHTFNYGDDISNGRIDRYLPAIEMFKEHPFFGIGWEQFRYQYIKYSDVHNIYLQLLCETGIIGAIVFFTVFISGIIITVKQINISINKALTVERKILTFSMYCQIFFLIYGLTGNGLYDYYILFFYVLALLIMVKTRYSINSVRVS